MPRGTMIPKCLYKNDEMGLGVGKIPYYGLTLSAEEAELVKNKKPTIYRTDGITLFSVKDDKGNITGKLTLFILFE